MDNNFETFVLFYTAWNEGEMSLQEMREMLVVEIGEAGLSAALAIFREKRLEREAAGVFKTLYDTMQSHSSVGRASS